MRQPAVRCVEFVELVTEWMEGALDDIRREVVEEHLVICPHCSEYVAQIRSSLVLLAAVGVTAEREAPPAAARDALLAAFRAQRGPEGP